ncbi:MAG: hypothetical protein ACOC8D_02170 [bacterium]
MTLWADCGWAVLRGSGIVLAGVVTAGGMRALIASAPRRRGRLLWALHLVPWLTPVALVGYAWSRYSLSLIRHPGWIEALYCVLVWLRLTPVATLALHFAPTPIAPEALHCHRLARRSRGLVRGAASGLGLWVRGPGRAAAVAFALVFLLAFGEFEVANLMSLDTWTRALFDAQLGGLPLLASLRLAAPAVACEAGLLLVVLAVLASCRPTWRIAAGRRTRPRGMSRAALYLYLLAALSMVAAVPAFVVLRGTLRDVGLLTQSLTLGMDIGSSILFAALGAVAAYAAAGLVVHHVWRHGSWRLGLAEAFLLCVPGLLGPLVLGLVLLAGFQLPGLEFFYDAPLPPPRGVGLVLLPFAVLRAAVPLVTGLTLLLFPFALLLRALLAVSRPAVAAHAAALLAVSSDRGAARQGRRTLWALRRRGLFWVGFVLFWWGYFEVAASHVLHPPGMTPVLVRLYNFMHYGQTAALSAMACVAVAVPFVLLAVAWLARAGLRWVAAR